MEIIKIEREAFLIDSKEKEKMIQVYKYARHRVVEHPDSGAKLIDVRYLDYVLAQLEGRSK